ncbi:hypothetical protein BT63DRAFT_423045 [Microthyrium microscopicum]|uniref:Transcription factor domain-containing protein n=1 Tax=Microthyrium microscopicum TaxID=703497 RepID=A0A6A6UEY3_9PEZI|nr:hypothetical protein BT63DRAFT_423045 [Microthyrium microscopicum]
MAKMMVRDSASASPGETDEGQQDTQDAMRLRHQSLQLSSSPPASIEHPQAPVGQIVFQEGYSAYYDSDFWPVLISEIEDLRRLFDAEPNNKTPWMSSSVLGLHIQMPTTDQSIMRPTVQESNMLCRLYFENVNPFMKILHQSHFAKELDQYRRGVFPFSEEYEALLFSIYLLTVNSLQPQVVETMFCTAKPALVARFQLATQVALMRVNFIQTDKVLVFQALLHYLVR